MGETVSGSGAGAMVGELYHGHGRGPWWANCVKIVVGEDRVQTVSGSWAGGWWANYVRIMGGGDDERTVSGSWAEAMVGELYEDHGRGRW